MKKNLFLSWIYTCQKQPGTVVSSITTWGEADISTAKDVKWTEREEIDQKAKLK